MKMSTNKRNNYIDILKGLTMFLVVWGHCIQYLSTGDYFNNKLFQLIYSFHMPMFALIGGYLLYFSIRKHTMRDLLWGKVRTILYPTLLWSLIYFALNFLSRGGYYTEGSI